jgi:hypothetical protein
MKAGYEGDRPLLTHDGSKMTGTQVDDISIYMCLFQSPAYAMLRVEVVIVHGTGV